MATVKCYVNGATMGRGNKAPVGGKRGKINGWTRGSVREHKRWLYGIDVSGLDGVGYGVTLTLRNTPATHHEWVALVDRLWRAFGDAGVLRWHGVVEWQRRGTPHLHLAVYVPQGWAPAQPPITDNVGAWTVAVWLRIAAAYRPGEVGQDHREITGPLGWLEYLSKHASRGVAHYQRRGKPAGWEGTGRLWRKGGSWPTVEPVVLDVDDWTMRRLRRLVRSFIVAEARGKALATRPGSVEARRAWARVAWARRMLRCNDRGLSAVRGLSEWVPRPVLLSLAACAGWDGQLVVTEVAA